MGTGDGNEISVHETVADAGAVPKPSGSVLSPLEGSPGPWTECVMLGNDIFDGRT